MSIACGVQRAAAKEQKQHVAALINLGVEFFVSDRMDDAATVFDGAMHALIKIMKMETCCSDFKSHLCEANQLLLDFRNVTHPNLADEEDKHQSRSPRLAGAALDNACSISRAENDPFMFCKAFRVTIPLEDSTLTTGELSVLAGILLFNRALCRQLKAESSKMRTSFEIYQTRMQQAAMLYTFCYEATVPSIQHPSSDNTAATAQLSMASLNNLALLLQEGGDYAQAGYYLSHLEDLTRYCIKFVPDEDFCLQRMTFLLNALLLKPPSTAACA